MVKKGLRSKKWLVLRGNNNQKVKYNKMQQKTKIRIKLKIKNITKNIG